MPEPIVRRARRRFLTRFLLPLGIAIAAATPFLLDARHIIHMGLLETIDNAVYDAKINIMGLKETDPRVVIIDIDDASLLAEGQWPWPRDKMASLLNNLFDLYGARAVGFDIVFAEPDRVTTGVREVLDVLVNSNEFSAAAREKLLEVRNARDTDAEFAQVLLAKPTVLGFIFTKIHSLEAEMKTGLLPDGVEVSKLADLTAHPYQAVGYLANLPLLQLAATSGGFFDNPMVDDDGVYRRMPLLQYHEGMLYEALGLALLRVAEGLPPPALGTHDEGPDADIDYIKSGQFHVPVDDNIAVLVPYRGKQGSFPYISATDVLNETAPIDILFDRIVLIGTTAPGLFDLRSTPVDSTYAGVEIHANIISGIMDGRIWYKPDWAPIYNTIAILTAALLLALTIPFLSPLPGALLVLAIVTLGVVLNFVLAFGGYMVLPVAGFVASTLGVSMLLIGLNVVTERRKKRYLSRTFAKYVPQELVAQFETTEAEVTLEGESRDMSILFSDVRNFTSISEHLPPTELTRLMNDYLTPITKVIHDHRGNVDKYIGDAVMAFWGAPLENPRHAQDAIEAAMGMQQVLVEIRDTFRQRGWPELHMGIGINSGVVNIGNMGSEFRTAYTVMGDVVNLASRLEGLSRMYDARIVVGETTVSEVNGYCFRELDRVRVRGKEEPITIYEPLGRQSEVSEERMLELEEYLAALALYRQRDWASALTAFQVLADANPHRALYRLYALRCSEFIRQPPPEDWDGIFRMTKK